MRKSAALFLLAAWVAVSAPPALAQAPFTQVDRESTLEPPSKPSQHFALIPGPRVVITTDTPGHLVGHTEEAGLRLDFEARSLGAEKAEARFWTKDGSVDVISRIESPTEGWIRVDGLIFTGRGEIGATELERLERLTVSALVGHVALIPMQLGCSGLQAESLPALAALIQPWQILFKYTAAPILDHRVLALAGCGPAHEPEGGLVRYKEGVPVARAFGFYTLDTEGASLRSITAASVTPCDATCRGACGANCTSSSCTNYGSCNFQCGTHWFCQYHDSCYDNCHEVHGCGLGAFLCERDCDDDCLGYGFDIETCLAWADGNGPYDGPETGPYGDPGFLTFSDGCENPPPVSTGGGGGISPLAECSCDCDYDGWVTVEECVFDCNGTVNGNYCDV